MTEVLIKVQVPGGLGWEELDRAVYEAVYEHLANGNLQDLYDSITDEVEA